MKADQKPRRFPNWLLCVCTFIAGSAGPLALANLMQAEKRSALTALHELSTSCDCRDAAYRNKSEAQDGLIAEMQKGLQLRDQLLASKGTL